MLIDFRQLFPKYDIKPKGVLHVGAHTGEEAPVYLELGIKRQVWVEANPDLIPRLTHQLSGNDEAIILNFAAGEVNSDMMLNISSNDGQSSSILELGTHKIVHPDVRYVSAVSVPVVRLDSVPMPFCDFLNLDVQGYEGHVLRGMGDMLKQFRWIYTEVSKDEVYKGCMTLESMDLFMTVNGFRRVELFNSGGFFDRLRWSDSLYIR